MQEIIMTEEYNEGKDEIYTYFYRCPECGNGNVMKKDNYCSNCGGKFTWE